MTDDKETSTRIPLIEETLSVSKRVVQTGHARVRTIVDERVEHVQAELAHDQIAISRRIVERAVDVAPEPYDEGGAWVVPVVEERLVIEKRLFVVEEIVMRRSTVREDVSIPTTVRKMRAVIDGDIEISAQQTDESIE